MQTFLPYPEFIKSADILDKKRCWKQCVEARQILDVLEHRRIGWKKHPAVKMWQGYRPALRYYFNTFLFVAKHKHKINTKYQFLELHVPYPRIQMPWWINNEDFHRAMRARLIEKDQDFYLPLFPDDKGFNDGKYFWPIMETRKFKII